MLRQANTTNILGNPIQDMFKVSFVDSIQLKRALPLYKTTVISSNRFPQLPNRSVNPTFGLNFVTELPYFHLRALFSQD